MLPSQTSPTFEDDMTAKERNRAGLTFDGRRMTTRQKKEAEKALQKKQNDFKKLVGLQKYS